MNFKELLRALEQKLSQNTSPVSLTDLGFNLILGLAIALVLRWHYSRYARSIANRADLAKTFPLVVLATILIITIVKSSLALSLGLVGALSIVRFRTPIKEPEELAYLFIAISVGLGLGAGQAMATVFAIGVILVATALLRLRENPRAPGGVFLTATQMGEDLSPDLVQSVHDALREHATHVDLRRLDLLNDRLEMVMLVDLGQSDAVTSLLGSLRTKHPGLEVSIVDQQQLPGV